MFNDELRWSCHWGKICILQQNRRRRLLLHLDRRDIKGLLLLKWWKCLFTRHLISWCNIQLHIGGRWGFFLMLRLNLISLSNRLLLINFFSIWLSSHNLRYEGWRYLLRGIMNAYNRIFNLIILRFFAWRGYFIFKLFILAVFTVELLLIFLRQGDTWLLFAELLARFILLFIFELYLYVTDDHSLDFDWSVPVLKAEARTRTSFLSYSFCEVRMSVPDIELVSVSSRMHHKLLLLKVVSFGHKVSNYMRVFWKQSLVIYFLPFKPLAKLSASIWVGQTNSWESKVLQVQVTNKVKLSS